MDDHDAVNNDDDPQSHSPTPSPTPSPPHPPAASAGPTRTPIPPASAAVTVAASPHHQTLTLALPIQTSSPASAASNGGGGGGNGREDCWSEGATSNLIDAWGERYLELNRGNLKQKHWQEVADAVSARDDYTKPPKTDVQCKNRIDTLKKKYKSEKSKIASGQSRSSAWPFFYRLNILIGPNFLKPPAPSGPAARSSKPRPTPTPPPPAFPPQFPQKTRTQTMVNSTVSNVVAKKRSRSPSVEPEEEKESSPEDGESNGWRELTRAIVRFGEVYERVERAKTQQAVEMEKQRMGFARELELQRMQFFVKTQMELSQLKGPRPGSHPPRKRSGGDDQRHRRSPDNGNGDGNNSV